VLLPIPERIEQNSSIKHRRKNPRIPREPSSCGFYLLVEENKNRRTSYIKTKEKKEREDTTSILEKKSVAQKTAPAPFARPKLVQFFM
jgi:hypothetical protein